MKRRNTARKVPNRRRPSMPTPIGRSLSSRLTRNAPRINCGDKATPTATGSSPKPMEKIQGSSPSIDPCRPMSPPSRLATRALCCRLRPSSSGFSEPGRCGRTGDADPPAAGFFGRRIARPEGVQSRRRCRNCRRLVLMSCCHEGATLRRLRTACVAPIETAHDTSAPFCFRVIPMARERRTSSNGRRGRRGIDGRSALVWAPFPNPGVCQRHGVARRSRR